MVSYGNLNEEVRHAYNHLRFVVDGVLQLLKVYRPLGGGGSPCRAILGRVKRDVADLSTGHLNVANVPLGPSDGSHGRSKGDSLVEEGFEDDHLVAGLDEAHEGTQHT